MSVSSRKLVFPNAGAQFLEDLDEQRLEQKLGTLRRSLLVMRSPVGEIVRRGARRLGVSLRRRSGESGRACDLREA